MSIRTIKRFFQFPFRFLGHIMETATVKNFNIFILGLAFMLVFTGFNTMSGIQAMIFNSATNEKSKGYVPGFEGNGFTSSAIIYGVFSVASWLAPSAVAWKGPRVAMIIAGVLYAQYIAQLLYPNTYLLYVSAAIIGIGAPIIWTAQGNFLSLNSDDDTISRNSGIVWAMLQCSIFIGNIFVYFMFAGEQFISTSVRTTVGIVLLSITGAGVLVMLLLRPTPWVTDIITRNESPTEALRNSGRLFITKDMLMLSVTFLYTGLQLSIWSGVYPTCVGYTHTFGNNRKALATICMIFIAAGEVLGGAVFGFFGHLTARRGRDPIVILGFITSMISYFLIFLNIPFEAPLDETKPEDVAYITSNQYLAVFTAFILGFSDSCFNTQITSILGGAFKEQSSSAFAIFKFMQSMSAAVAFFYSPHLKLQWQLLFAVVFDVLGTITFCKVEWAAKKRGETLPTKDEVDNSCGVVQDEEVSN